MLLVEYREFFPAVLRTCADLIIVLMHYDASK